MTSDYTPEVIIYPFHGRVPDMNDLYHARCTLHPRFTPCGTLTEIGREVEQHLEIHKDALPTEPTLDSWFRKIGTQLSNEDYEEGIRLLAAVRRNG